MEKFIWVIFILTCLNVGIKLLVLSFLDRENKGVDVLELVLAAALSIWASLFLFSA
ncbi:hypothetical protein KAR91_83930 [Candidatus Pacearchaeota archaeon]|nr:hypothetical protein [Candidatus Pacearchaeota archaeon]